MRRVQVVLDENLLKAADHFAHRIKVNRSALMRNALREYLRKLYYQDSNALNAKATSGSLIPKMKIYKDGRRWPCGRPNRSDTIDS